MGVLEFKTKPIVEDIGANLKMNNRGFLRMFQEAANIASTKIGFGITQTEATHFTWVILYWRLEIIDRPQYDDEITIKTWATFSKKLYSIRNFEMYVGENGVVTVKTSKSANATVIFAVGDKNVTAKVVNGIAKLSLKDFKVGDTDIDAHYIGENGFNCNLYACVNILNTKIQISNVNVVYSNNAKVKVYINEKLAKNTYVTFKVSGKTLKVKTDKNGVATFSSFTAPEEVIKF